MTEHGTPTTGSTWHDPGQPARFLRVFLTFALVGPLIGLFTTRCVVALTAPARFSQTSSVRSAKDLGAVLIDFLAGVFFGLTGAFTVGIIPAVLTGLYVAWRARNMKRVSVMEGALAAWCVAALSGITLRLVFELWTSSRDSFELVLYFLLVPSLVAGAICTKLTQRWQGPPLL